MGPCVAVHAGASVQDAQTALINATSGTTIALYMPGADARVAVQKLAAAGVTRQTSCALVSRASTSAQQITLTTLKELEQVTMQAKPSILIIGDVARLSQHDKLRLKNVFAQPLPPQPVIAAANENSSLNRNGAVNHG